MQELGVSVLMDKDEKAKLKKADDKSKKRKHPSMAAAVPEAVCPTDDAEEFQTLDEEMDKLPDALQDVGEDLRMGIAYIPIHHHTSIYIDGSNILDRCTSSSIIVQQDSGYSWLLNTTQSLTHLQM